jgi:hypothetical protein
MARSTAVITDVELDDSDVLTAKRVGVALIASADVAYAGEHAVAGACQRFRSVAAKARRGTADEDGFGHGKVSEDEG